MFRMGASLELRYVGVPFVTKIHNQSLRRRVVSVNRETADLVEELRGRAIVRRHGFARQITQAVVLLIRGERRERFLVTSHDDLAKTVTVLMRRRMLLLLEPDHQVGILIRSGF